MTTAGILMFNSSFPGSPNIMRFANNRTGGDFDWVAFGQPKMALFNEGNLLVGNKLSAGAATARLDVDGQVRIRGGSPGVGKVLTSDGDGVGSWQDGGSDGDWTISGANLFSAVSGKVGIGVDPPQTKLHVRTADSGSLSISSSADDLLVENNSHGGVTIRTPDSAIGTLAFADSGASLQGTVRYLHADDSLTLNTNGNVERVRIDSAGRVGVGLVAPQAKLHVRSASSGSLSLSSAADDLLVENDSHGGVTIRTPDTVIGTLAFADSGASLQGAVRYLHADDSLTLNTNGNVEQVRIDSAGNVGVADTSPTFKLDVNGTLRSTGAAEFNSTVNIGNDASFQGGLNVASANGSQGVAVFNLLTTDGTLVRFRRDGSTKGTIDVSGSTVSYNAFTGSHYGVDGRADGAWHAGVTDGREPVSGGCSRCRARLRCATDPEGQRSRDHGRLPRGAGSGRAGKHRKPASHHGGG